jgi:hypothetical protein
LDVYLVDGTYELFRHYYAVPSVKDKDGREVGAVRGVINSVRGLIKGGATHLGVATDHVIESFRNAMWPGYKTGEGIDPDLCRNSRFSKPASLRWAWLSGRWWSSKADDALAAAAAKAALDPRVWSASSSARLTRISRSASAAHASCR